MEVKIMACLFTVAAAMPSYIAVPADQIAFVDLSEMRARRVPRQTLTPPPLPNLYSQNYQQIPIQLFAPDQPVPIQQFAPEKGGQLQRFTQDQAIPIQRYTQDQPIPIQYTQNPAGLAPPAQPEGPARLVHLPQGQDVSGAATLGGSLAERPPDFGEFVDFGAHTGDNGAFGWYADYPINNHDDHSSHSSGYHKF